MATHEPRIKILPVTNYPNRYRILMEEEDHTMGNLLASYMDQHMMPDPVTFVAYGIEGDEKVICLRLALTDGNEPKNVLQTCINALMTEIQEGHEKFRHLVSRANTT